MNNNEVLKNIRDILNCPHNTLIEIAALMDAKVLPAQLEDWLRDIGEAGRVDLSNKMLAIFLEGLVLFKRGKKEGAELRPLESSMSNNIILKKLRVAFELQENDIVSFAENAPAPTPVKEWNTYFRKEGHKNYKECPDSFLNAIFGGLKASIIGSGPENVQEKTPRTFPPS